MSPGEPVGSMMALMPHMTQRLSCRGWECLHTIADPAWRQINRKNFLPIVQTDNRRAALRCLRIGRRDSAPSDQDMVAINQLDRPRGIALPAVRFEELECHPIGLRF